MTTANWIVVISAVIGSGGIGAFASSLVRLLLGRPTVRAEATKHLTDAAMMQVDQLQERVKDAEETTARTQKRMHEVERDADDLGQQLRAVRREAADLAERMAMLARWIHEPSMTIAELRIRVPLAPGTNGGGR